ncbi:hypothetical protein JCM33374_g5768 [Metschnikowia sp. JCM 33374]|nr:hypothetical protein JCM33374_g5768 [Metschnikowia sp. JCM 33374]
MTDSEQGSSFVNALAHRLELILPNRTGSSLAEVELNSQFIITTNLILKNCKPNEFNGHQDFFSEILNALVALLEKLNLDPTSQKLIERAGTVLTSTVILTRLLRIIAITNWDPERKYSEEDDSSLDIGIKFDIESGVTRDNFELYAHTEPPAVHINTDHVLDVLFTILSPEVNIQALSDIRKFSSTAQNTDYSVSAHVTQSPRELRAQILEIDSNISIVLRYIAASNPSNYATFVRRKLFSWVDRGEHIPVSVLQRYACSLMYVYCTPNNTSFYLKMVYSSITYIRSNTWKQLLLHYESMSLRTQCINKPGFYSKVIYAGSAAEQECKIIFDYYSTAFEHETNANTSLYSWYVILCPSDFDELLSKTNKLKQVFNRRVKFLNSMLKDSQAGVNLDCFESLISILLLGSLLPESECGVRHFSTRFLDETYNNLLKMRSKCINEALLSRFRVLYQKIFTAAIVINPEKYIPLFIREFQRAHEIETQIFYDNSKTLDSYDLLEIIMALSSQNRYRDKFDLVMKKLNSTVSNIMHCCSKILFHTKSSIIKPKLSSDHSQIDSFEQLSLSLDDENSLKSETWLEPSRSKIPEKQISLIDDILRLILDIYTECPLYFLQFRPSVVGDDRDKKVQEMLTFSRRAFAPVNMAIHSPNTCAKSLFNSACKLSMKLLQVGNEMNSSDEIHCISILISHNVIHSTCEVIGSLTYHASKEYFIFLKSYLSERYGALSRAQRNVLYQSKWAHIDCDRVCTSLDKLLMLSLCTHDIQFFSLLKLSIKAHAFEVSATKNRNNCFQNSLAESFSDVMGDDIVFTGFVSLHKKFKSILTDFEPTKGLYDAWLMIYSMWAEMIDDRTTLNDDSFTFKHYTEFLAATSGCFLDGKLEKTQIGSQDAATAMISSFYDKAIALLNCEQLFVSVVIREALSAETHSGVYQMIFDKLMDKVKVYIDQSSVSAASVLFIEETISIFTSILNIKSDGSFILGTLFPEVIESFFEYVNIVPNMVDQIQLKSRLCKLISAISAQRQKFGLAGAYKSRNIFAKTVAEWLDSSVSYSTFSSTELISPTASQVRASDVEFLQIELSTECAKCFASQLESLVLSVPDGTKESNFVQAKDLAFSNFFSLFYKILQKFNGKNPSPLMIKSKYKIQTIVDHVLKAVSYMLHANVGIGLIFALPLGYHENEKIRPVLLDIFATTLTARISKLHEEEFPDEKIYRLSELFDVYGAAAGVASPAEHNLLATSLNGLFGYTMHLDKLFLTLLDVEMQSVSRASDIFRGNSTLTRLMSIFAKEYGTPYLSVVLRPLIEEMVDQNVVFEVERDNKEEDVELFIKYLRKLVSNVVDSMPWSFFDLTAINSRVRRSLMQIVKTIQYMANGSISNLKWASLAGKSEVMNEMNHEIFAFMKNVATPTNETGYVFHRITLKPLTCLRYIHKFFYTYFVEIRCKFLIGDVSPQNKTIQERIIIWRKLDAIMAQLGNPRPSISLQGSKSYKAIDSESNLGNSQFAEFMAKMSAKNIETSIESPIIKKKAYHDGTPVIVITFRYIKEISFDVSTLVYLLLESASQVWENQFYCVVDLTQFFYMGIIGKNFTTLMRTYAPKIFFMNCKRAYYYNLPRASHLSIIESLSELKTKNATEGSIFLYSEQDKPEEIEALCLSEATMAIPQDVKFVCKTCKLYDDVTHEFTDVTIKLGRSWLSIWFKRHEFDHFYASTKTVAPVEVLKLSDLVKCEISNKSGESNEFTLYLNRFNYQVTLVTPQRQEVLRFLYFAMLRSSKTSKNHKSAADELEIEQAQRFSALASLSFHGFLQKNEQVRIAASNLLKSFSCYYDITFDSSSRNFSKSSFPVDMTDYVVSFSSKLADQFPQYSYEFLKIFFANFDKLTDSSKISGIMYISPWVVNLHEHISKEIDGVDKMAFIIRQLCKITTKNPLILSFMKELIWKRIFRDMRMTSILVDELVAIAIEIASESDDWNIIISVFYPSVELCGELVSRIHDCISNTKNNDSEIAIQSRFLEISILVKICASLFFDSSVYGSLYLSDVFLFCTIFIDRSDLDFGHDLQSLVLSTIQSFSGRPSLTDDQKQLLSDTVEYFSGQRAKMLFGLTTRGRGAHIDYSQNYERSLAFEHLCDYLNNFISKIGSADDKRYWVSRWSSLSKDIAFSDSFFQMRAYIIVCTLARSGISDSVGGRIMEILTSQLFDNPDTFFEGSVCFLRLRQGLSSDSVYLPLLLWIVATAILSDFPLNYQAMISSLGASFESMISDKGFADSVFSYRPNLEPLLDKFEQSVGTKICPKNYEFVFLFLISKGLIVSQSRHTSIMTIKNVITKKMKHQNAATMTNAEEGDFFLSYLLMFYLLVPDLVFQKFLVDIGLHNIPMTQLGRDRIPNILLDGLCSSCKPLRLAFILAAHIFSGECEQIFKLKFIGLYEKVLEKSRDSGLIVFHIIKARLEDSFINAASNSLSNDISAILMQVVRDGTYSSKKFQDEISNELQEIQVSVIGRVNKIDNFDSHESLHSITLVRQMFYQNLCSAIDGSKLEKY